MNAADDDPETPPSPKDAVEKTLSKLREIADGRAVSAGEAHLVNADRQQQDVSRTSVVSAMKSHKTVTAVSMACASAGVVAVLAILSEYFE